MPMHKRILCLALAALLLLSLIPALALPSRAASNMKTSEACIAMLKEFEGFAEYAYFDYSHYSIGYGSTCDPDDYPNGITEAEADALLREFIASMEEELNRFANRTGILFSQYQFDALMLFTYNVGTGWMYSDGDFRQAVIDNATGNEFIYPFTLWSSAGGKMNVGLVNRRLMEANMYLNGSYAKSRPANYTYAMYDNNGGTAQPKVQGYDCNLDAPVKSQPTREGYVFLGWYTAVEGGAWVRSLTAEHSQKTIYAHWQPAGAAYGAAAAVSYQIPAGELASLDTYDAPGGNVSGSLNQDAVAVVEADYVDSSGMKWGRLITGRWAKLGHPLVGTGKEPEVIQGLKVNVTGDYVNVRTGPGTGYPVVAAVVQGDVIGLTRVVSVEDTLWGQFRAGWVCLEYTDYAGGLPVEEPGDIPQIPGTPEAPQKPDKPAEKVVITGTVTANRLYIRSSAGSKGTPVGSYGKGDRVEILETTSIGSTPWGRTDKGWICMTYVELDSQEEVPETTEPAVPETTEPTVPETTAPPATEPEQEAPASGARGTVISKSGLNVRSGPGTNYGTVGSYKPGQTIRILERTVVSGVSWGRTDLGWVCMQYVRLEENQVQQQSVYGLVVCTGGLNIRSGAGVAHKPVGSYAPGSRILILEQVTAGGCKWGRTNLGWVCMDYVRLETASEEIPEQTEPETNPPETTVPETTVPPVTEPEKQPEAVTGTVTASGLNIRRNPGTGAPVVGSYRKGDSVTILETRQVNGATWGRTDKGWISLVYVSLDPREESGLGFTGTITADVLCIRKGPGTGNVVVGSYKRGQTVTILEQTRVGVTLWGRTDKGWICMDYVK